MLIVLLIVSFFLIRIECDTNAINASSNKYTNGTIRVGILHSLTGTMSISENTVVDSVLLAIEEINEDGGVLGSEIVPVLYDGASDWPTFAERAQNLIDLQKVKGKFFFKYFFFSCFWLLDIS